MIVARGRRYFSNDGLTSTLEKYVVPATQFNLGVVPSAKLYELGESTLSIVELFTRPNAGTSSCVAISVMSRTISKELCTLIPILWEAHPSLLALAFPYKTSATIWRAANPSMMFLRPINSNACSAIAVIEAGELKMHRNSVIVHM